MDSTETSPATYPRGDTRRGGCQTPLPSPTLENMDRHAGEPRYLYSTPDHLRQHGIEVVDFQTYQAEEES